MEKVVIFTAYAFSLTQFRGNLIKEMISRGHSVHAVAPDFTSEIRRDLAKWGVTCHDSKLNRTGLNLFSDMKAVFETYKLLRSLKPDCLLAYNAKAIIYGTVCGFFARVKHRVAMVEGLGTIFVEGSAKFSFKKFSQRKIISQMYKLALALAHRSVFLNQDDIDFFHGENILCAQKATLLGGIGVDLDQWQARTPVGSPITFVMAARLLKEKGVEDYVEAARLVKAAHRDARFILLGGLDQNPTSFQAGDVQRWVDEGVVEWPGHVPVLEWLYQSSVFVLPSYYREGVPRSSQEALAVGLPLITTDSVGCRDTVIDGENGYLVPIKDPVALAEKMMCFVQNPESTIEMGRKSRELAESKFSEKVKIAYQLEILRC